MVPIAKPSKRSLTQALRQVVERGFGLEGLQPSLVARNPDLPAAFLDPRLIPIVDKIALELVEMDVFRTMAGAKSAIMGMDRNGARTMWTPFIFDPENQLNKNILS